jgi:hypothetical protein
MRMPKPVKETKTAAINADAYGRAAVKRMLAAMEAFMAIDPAAEVPAALTQRAA